jgi:hypothetical protein
VVPFDPHSVFDLQYFHAGETLQQFGHDAFARWVQVLDHHEPDTRGFWHVLKELFERFEATGGSAETHDWERRSA